MRQVQRPSCEGSTLPLLLTVCTVKDALMLLLKGATYLETPKHDSVLKVQKQAICSVSNQAGLVNTRNGRRFIPITEVKVFRARPG